MPLVDDQAWDLPYDVVTIPLNDAPDGKMQDT